MGQLPVDGIRLYFDRFSREFAGLATSNTFPGIAAVALIIIAWSDRRNSADPRFRMAAAAAIGCAAVSFAPLLPSYPAIHEAVPLFQAVRSLPLILTGAGRAAAPPFSGGVFARLARWLVLALEFALAADIVRTAIEPTWKDIGMLASIAVIRTFLNYFLMRDLEKVLERKELAESG